MRRSVIRQGGIPDLLFLLVDLAERDIYSSKQVGLNSIRSYRLSVNFQFLVRHYLNFSSASALAYDDYDNFMICYKPLSVTVA
jgi:hypothetical protein